LDDVAGNIFQAVVGGVIARLGLGPCADTLVGGNTGGKAVLGISGGRDNAQLNAARHAISRVSLPRFLGC
jgi:hypothetical protein